MTARREALTASNKCILIVNAPSAIVFVIIATVALIKCRDVGRAAHAEEATNIHILPSPRLLINPTPAAKNQMLVACQMTCGHQNSG